jgi:hypothetical protein
MIARSPAAGSAVGYAQVNGGPRRLDPPYENCSVRRQWKQCNPFRSGSSLVWLLCVSMEAMQSISSRACFDGIVADNPQITREGQLAAEARRKEVDWLDN